jgi:hypothetical protein
VRPRKAIILGALAFLFLAALLRLWIAPFFENLPADFASEAKLTEENKFRDSPDGEWQVNTLNVHRVDQAITNHGQVAIIEGAFHVYYTSGDVNFEVINLYGVDRRTRLNLPGYGDVNRTGQYLFPPHVKRVQYSIWDPMFVGLRQAVFERTEKIDGLQAYVFSFSATGMDESAGYSYLPIVPEQYLARTDGKGTIWVEPLSGIVVDYLDNGVSYFVIPSTGLRIADFNQLNERYTPETRTAQIQLARTARSRILLLDFWLPGVFLAIGLIGLAIGLIMRQPRNL